MIRLLIVKGDGAKEIGTIRHLEQLIGVKRHVAGNVLNGYLFPIGALKKVRGQGANNPFVSKGRPTVLYIWDESGVNQWLRDIKKQPQEPHFELTRAVLRFGDWGADVTLLLAVLLSKADALGVARELPSKAIRQFAGFKRDKLKKTLSSLMELGLLRLMVPGGTVRTIFGAVSSTYQVNIDTVLKGLGQTGLGKGVVELSFHRSSDVLGYLRDVKRNAHTMLRENSSLAKELKNEEVVFIAPPFPKLGASPQCLLAFFGKNFRWPEHVSIVICKIQGYASHILTNFWSELENPSFFNVTIEELTKDFFWDVVPKSLRSEVESSNDLRAEFLEVTHFLLCFAWKEAVGVKRAVQWKTGNRPEWKGISNQRPVIASVITEEGGGVDRSYVCIGYPKRPTKSREI